MRAVGFNHFGGPEVLEVMDLPASEPGPGEVRIAVAAATVNPTDIGLRSGARPERLAAFSPPYIAGMEAAGTIERVGEGVAWDIGDEVMAIVLPQRTGWGAQSEFCVVPAASVSRIPIGKTLVEAATVPMNGLTVRHAFDSLGQAQGDSLLVTGAAGAVGSYAVQFGAAAGLTVIAVASPEDEAFVRSLGATHFLPRGDDLGTRVRAILPEGVDAVIDAALVGRAVLDSVRDNGKVEAVREFDGDSERGITIHRVAASEYAENTAALDDLRARVERNELTLRVAETYSPERAGEAHERLAAGGVRGRLVIVF